MKIPDYPHPLIAREGWLIIGAAILASILVAFWSLAAAVPVAIFALFALQFFRDPARAAPEGENLLLSPADGRIVSVEACSDPYCDGRAALKISVFMNVFNVHSNRCPLDASVVSVSYFPGKFVNADLDKASLENERNAVVLRRADGSLVTAVQVAGLIARRILCHVRAGDNLYAGQRYGFIRFGSRVDVYLPPESRPQVVIGEKVSATSTVLAILPPLQSSSDPA